VSRPPAAASARRSRAPRGRAAAGERGGDRDGARDVLPAGPAAALLGAAVLERLEPDTASHEEKAAPAGPDLGSREGSEVDAAKVDLQPLGALAGVEVDQCSRRMDPRLHGARLVVGEGGRDEAGSRQVGLRVAALGVDREDLDPAALQLQPAHRAQHRLVLRRPGHDRYVMRQPAAGAEQGEVHRLGARGREDDLGRLDAESVGSLVAGPVEGGQGGPALGMGARRVAGRDACQG
jgi:hypothetical protein